MASNGLALFAGLLLLCSSAWATQPGDPFPEVAASYLVEINGDVVWGRQPQRRLPPASLTKLMTALLTVEQDKLDASTIVGRAAARASATRFGIR